MPKKQSQNKKGNGRINLLNQLKKDITKKFKGRNLVFGYGKENADVMMVSEFINSDEETNKKILSGVNGKILNKMLKTHGFRKNNFYLTSAVKFKPDTDAPSPKEIKQSSVFLRQEIKIINPKVIVALGGIALRGLGVKLPLNNVRGRLVRFGEMNLFATHHPSSIAQNASLETEVSVDFKKLKNIMEEVKKPKERESEENYF